MINVYIFTVKRVITRWSCFVHNVIISVPFFKEKYVTTNTRLKYLFVLLPEDNRLFHRCLLFLFDLRHYTGRSQLQGCESLSLTLI